ncbi:transcriptional regulator [Sphaerisporangium melleum]|uniref:Transcriptional regulator n=1 Tax=Sphaerisporangium melleum TaxID=321316 RepID=A0A917R4N4_9ACTN|nr:helix-turn-helix transcriptional regulator [Sphaerisporangium melleum]GGK88943.1 transcriptional regulator [Sphaerisporangium melleum]GII67745.1 transcriptional regulator [Sphaerisporangium melleum]
MGRERHLDPNTGPRAFFGSELRRCRKRIGLSQPQLGERTTCSPDMIGKIERGERPPSPEFVQKCDEIFGLDGHFHRLYQFMLQTPGPAWFTRWLEEIEPQATVLRTWDPLLIPGLLQTEDYARCVFRGAPGITPEEVEERLQIRMRRKALLEREPPPMMWILIDEYVLQRPVADPETMTGQVRYLVEVAQRPHVTVQLVAASCVTGMMSAFMIAQLSDGRPDVVNVESSAEGRITADHEVVAQIWSRYDTIRASAYPEHLSRQMIEEAIPVWERRAGLI